MHERQSPSKFGPTQLSHKSGHVLHVYPVFSGYFPNGQNYVHVFESKNNPAGHKVQLVADPEHSMHGVAQFWQTLLFLSL